MAKYALCICDVQLSSFLLSPLSFKQDDRATYLSLAKDKDPSILSFHKFNLHLAPFDSSGYSIQQDLKLSERRISHYVGQSIRWVRTYAQLTSPPMTQFSPHITPMFIHQSLVD